MWSDAVTPRFGQLVRRVLVGNLARPLLEVRYRSSVSLPQLFLIRER